MERARDREKEGEEVNIKEEVKATTVSTNGLVEGERLRTQVAVVAGFGGALLILLSAAVLVLGVVVLRIAQELGSKGSPDMEGSEMGGRRNVGGPEMGNRGSMVPEMGGSRGRKYETADDGCTNRGFSGSGTSDRNGPFPQFNKRY